MEERKFVLSFVDLAEEWKVSVKDILSFVNWLIEKGFEYDHIDSILNDEDTTIYKDLNEAVLELVNDNWIHTLLNCTVTEFLNENNLFECSNGRLIGLGD